MNEGEFLLKHAVKFYTRNVFNKFKDEWSKVTLYKVEEIPCDDEYHAYLVKTKLGKHEEFVVKLNLQTYKGKCECQNFKFVGILCRHLLKVFVRLDIDTLPDHQGEALVAMVIIGLVISVYVALHRQII